MTEQSSGMPFAVRVTPSPTLRLGMPMLWKQRRMMEVNNLKLAERICDCISDGYDDEEYKEETITALCNELSQIDGSSYIKAAFVKLCETIEELET